MLDNLCALGDDDVVRWGGEKRPTTLADHLGPVPARLGGVLGWLLQLDGDNPRDAFLNAPWVKTVIPIQPRR